MTRAGIASLDRQSKERMHAKDKRLQKLELANAMKQTAINEQRAKYQNLESAAKATESLTKGASNMSSFTGGSGGSKGISFNRSSSYNHPQWYRKFELDKVTAQLPTYTRLGLPLSDHWLGFGGSSGVVGIETLNNLPGIMAIRLLSTIPNQPYGTGNQYVSSPINAGLSRFMAELRKMNSRIGDYDPSDFGLYWYAAAELIYVLGKISQCIQIYNTYYATNRYFAKSLIYANNFDAVNFFEHIQEYKVLLTKYCAIFNSSIVLPVNLTFLARRVWLSQALVRDHFGVKSQVYLFNFPYWGTLSEDETTISFANYDSSLSYNAVKNYVELAARRLTDSIGMQTMMADLRAGIPENKFFKLPFAEQIDKEVEFTDDEFNLEQIHNLKSLPMTVINHGNDWSSYVKLLNLNIHAMADGYIAQGQVNATRTSMTEAGPVVEMRGSAAAMGGNLETYVFVPDNDEAFLNFYSPNVTEDDILEATRLRHLVYVYSANDAYFVYPQWRGTEVVLDMQVKLLAEGTETLFTVPMSTTFVFEYATDADFTMHVLAALSTNYSRFDWCPIIKIAGITGDDSDVDIGFTLGEVDNYLPLSAANLKVLHEACTLSEFYIDSNEFMKALR